MSDGLDGAGVVWSAVLERFERHAPAGVMARLALEHALPAGWVDAVFEAHRERQYARELLFSTVVELMTLVSLGLRPSLHAAARQMEQLPVSLASLYDKVNHTEPVVLRALVRGSAGRSTRQPGMGQSSFMPRSMDTVAACPKHRCGTATIHAKRGRTTEVVEDQHPGSPRL